MEKEKKKKKKEGPANFFNKPERRLVTFSAEYDDAVTEQKRGEGGKKILAE